LFPFLRRIKYVSFGGDSRVEQLRRKPGCNSIDVYMPETVSLGPREEVEIDTKLQLEFPKGVGAHLQLRLKALKKHRLRMDTQTLGESDL
jgi:hypothetical protein